MALTPESLLASLHEHLAHHATLLPALHAQLGLPASTLALEFEQLQTTLRNVVEGQVKQRQEEVDDWMKQCGEVEAECLEFVKCLGGNARGSQSVGELRKIQILPTRHKQLLANRDRLRHTHQTKSDQLASLITRITNLALTLGPAFFPSDVTTLNAPSADSLFDIIDESSSRPADVTPERFLKVEKELMRGKAELSQRLTRLSETLQDIVWFYSELGMELPTPDVSAPASEGYEQILARFVARWEEAEDELLEGGMLGVEGVEPTNEVMDWAEGLKAELGEVKTSREAQSQKIYDQLEILWKRLGASEVDIDEFVEGHRGTRDETVQAYEAELERMLELKRESMSVFITNARDEIRNLWKELIMSADEQEEFTAMNDDEYSEELLARHEEEIARLKDELRVRAPILATIHKYFDICHEEQQLLDSANDQSRLLGRGPRDPGRLLREEKMRKRVKKEKPKLEQELLQILPGWEEERNRPFLVNGLRVVDVIQKSQEAQAAKHPKAKTAPKTVPARATTPGPSASQLPPGSRKHAATPSSNQPPAKRQRTTSTTTKPTRTVAVTPSVRLVSSSRTGKAVATPQVPPFGTQNANRPTSSMSIYSAGGRVTPTPAAFHLSNKMAGASTLGLGVPTTGMKGGRTASGTTMVQSSSRTASGTTAATKRVKRESFRPRASSIDGSNLFGMGGMRNLVGRLPSSAQPSAPPPPKLVELDENMFDGC